jgi:hypothetical protein
MTVFSMPVVALGKDRDGLPNRITIPGGTTRRVPLVVGGETLGSVDPDGNVLVGAVELVRRGSPPANMLSQLKFGDARFCVVIHDGEVAAVVARRR